ncbi:MAG: AMP-dependent synthetase and ligase [Rhodospirillaceae bacterium]|nr:MAG: AMP-dependent synthetase and ligase [Rhodospirillaceae bacterium]
MAHIGLLLPRHARYRPDRLCLVHGDNRLTWRAFNERVNRVVNALLKHGLRKGDKLATLLPNCQEQLELYFACAGTGIVVVPSSTLLKESGIATLLRDSDTVLVVAHRSFAGMLAAVRDRLPAIGAGRWILVGEETPVKGFHSYESLLEGAPAALLPMPV